jgi:hypothetical protein
MKRALVLAVLMVACKGKAKEDKRPKGKLCFAANTAETFGEYGQGGALTIKYRGKPIALPNEQVGFEDAREGEPVAVLREDKSAERRTRSSAEGGAQVSDKLVESWKVSWKIGTDLCYFFRPLDPAKPDRKPKWILDVNAPDDRCTCW